jgi:hypothetical protein
MNIMDEARPEPVLFLLEALDVMQEYYAIHKEYPANWNYLEINFASEPFRLGEPNTHPALDTGNKWRPKGCSYTYWIKYATKYSFVIQAINQNNLPEYEITQELNYPVFLLQ